MASLDTSSMTFSEVMAAYVTEHGDAQGMSQTLKTACNFGFSRSLEQDLRSALTEGRPIANWDSYALDSLKRLKQIREERSSAAA